MKRQTRAQKIAAERSNAYFWAEHDRPEMAQSAANLAASHAFSWPMRDGPYLELFRARQLVSALIRDGEYLAAFALTDQTIADPSGTYAGVMRELRVLALVD